MIDLGLDAQKRKQQASDEIDYEDGIDGKTSGVESSTELESEVDRSCNNLLRTRRSPCTIAKLICFIILKSSYIHIIICLFY